MKLPLQNRLPNAPPVFVGRVQEQIDLASAISRAPATVVVGHPGFGRLALVLATLHERHAQDIERCVFVAPEDADESRGWLREALARALDAASGGRSWRPEEPAQLARAAVEAAEQQGLWIVLRDIDSDDEPWGEMLLVEVARHGRRSRWLATSSSPIANDALAGQILVLGALGDADLRTIAQAADPSAPELVLSRAVGLGQGSPRRVLQQMVGIDTKAGTGTLARVPREGRKLLQALSVLQGMLPHAELGSFVAVPEPGVIASLARRRLILSRGDALGLHPEARVMGIPRMTPAERVEWQERARAALARSSDIDASFEALQLCVALGEVSESVRLLETCGERLIERGYAEPLALTLGTSLEPALHAWHARATESLEPRDVPLPSVYDPEAALRALRALPERPNAKRISVIAHTALAFIRAGYVALGEQALLLLDESPCVEHCAAYRRATWALGIARGRLHDALSSTRGQVTRESCEALLLAGQLVRLEEALASYVEGSEEIAARLSLLRSSGVAGQGLATLRAAARRNTWPERVLTPVSPVDTVWLALARAEHALARGSYADAWTEVSLALRTAEGHDLGGMLLEVLELALDLAFASDQRERIATLLVELRTRAARAPSTRFLASAALFAACNSPDGLDVAALLHSAEHDASVSPMAARRARALLGAPLELDAVDRRFIEAVHARGATHRARPIRTVQPWRPPLVLDERNKSLVFPERQSVSLEALPLLWRCLRSLADHGGEVDKSTLYTEAWQESEFHPLRHNNRLHTTINKLRKCLALTPGGPPVLVTTDAGYALAPTQPIVRVGSGIES